MWLCYIIMYIHILMCAVIIIYFNSHEYCEMLVSYLNTFPRLTSSNLIMCALLHVVCKSYINEKH